MHRQNKLKIKKLLCCAVVTVAMNELLCLKNAGAQISLFFTSFPPRRSVNSFCNNCFYILKCTFRNDAHFTT